MQIVIAVYPRFTALDAIGPYEVLANIPGAEVTFAAVHAGPITTDTGVLTIEAKAALADVPSPDVVVVPGGPGSRDVVHDDAFLAWLRAAHETSQWTTSVCTGSMVLAAAGVLDDVDVATTHWACVDELEALGATYTSSRVVERGKVVTAAGVSSGIDMALTLTARMCGDDMAKAIQLGIEYDPQPPFDSGSEAKADPAIVEMVRAVTTSPTPAG